MIFVERLEATKVREACIRYGWYTCGDTDEYDNMLGLCRMSDDVRWLVETIAKDIAEHSSTCEEAVDIAGMLWRNYVTRYVQ